MSPAVQGIVSAFLLVLFSEVGDKTFFIALLLALRNSKSDVFTGALLSLSLAHFSVLRHLWGAGCHDDILCGTRKGTAQT